MNSDRMLKRAKASCAARTNRPRTSARILSRLAVLVVGLALSACNTLTYYKAPAGSPTSRFTLSHDKNFEGIVGVHYVNSETCEGYEQLGAPGKPAKSIELEADKVHSFGVGASLYVVLGFPIAASKFYNCNSYITFPAEPGFDYDYRVTKNGDTCGFLLRRSAQSSDGRPQWENAPFNLRELVPYKGCKPATEGATAGLKVFPVRDQ